MRFFLCLAGLGSPVGAIDAVHKYMEPAMPAMSKPYVRPPPGSTVTALRRTGLLAAASRLVSRKRLLALLPVALTAAVVQYPDVMERVLLHTICFIGSLIGFGPQSGGRPGRA